MRVVMNLCEYIQVLDFGETIAHGTPEEIQGNPRVDGGLPGERGGLMLLSVEDLHVAYGPIEALHGITFHVKEGEIVTLIGANGAGKSTTLMSIMRLPPPEAPAYRSGRMTFQGQDLTRFSPHQVVSRLGISLVPEGRRIFGNLTVWENLKLAAYSSGRSPKDPAESRSGSSSSFPGWRNAATRWRIP